MATPSLTPAPVQTRHDQILEELDYLHRRWSGQITDPQHLNALIAADYRARKARIAFTDLQAFIRESSEPMHLWPDRLLNIYNQLKRRALKTTRQFMTEFRRK